MATIRGGQKLEAELAKLARLVKRRASVRVGFLEKAKYPGGVPVAAVAAFQEYGTPNARFPIPPRAFFRNMIARESPGWPSALANLLKLHGYDAAAALDLMGDGIAGQLRQSIIDTNAPPLSPVTLLLRQRFGNQPHNIRLRDVLEAARDVRTGQRARRQSQGGPSTKPLVWTGHLLGSVDHEVR
jgi:hypothetical protein